MKNKFLRNTVIFFASAIAFFVLTMPFRKVLSVFTATEVRPVAVLYPFLGISFGLPSALGIAVANCIADAVSGYTLTVLIEGFFSQIIYTMVPYFMWKGFTKSEEHVHRLDSVSRVLKYVCVVFVSALLSGIGVGLIVWSNYGADFFSCAFFAFLNNFDFGVMLGCPLMIISNQIISRRSGTKRTVSVNEKIIIAAAIAQIVSVTAIIISMYKSGTHIGTYDIWNSIYIYCVIAINVIMLLSLAVMLVYGKKSAAQK